jgi:hypothetical protein
MTHSTHPLPSCQGKSPLSLQEKFLSRKIDFVPKEGYVYVVVGVDVSVRTATLLSKQSESERSRLLFVLQGISRVLPDWETLGMNELEGQ